METEQTALALREAFAQGRARVAEVAQATLLAAERSETELKAFAAWNPRQVVEAAKRLDDYRLSGRPLGALHGVPIALSDLIDTRDLPTQNGTLQDTDRQPERDAAVVERLRSAGALLVGKTATAELGFRDVPATAHPQSEEHHLGSSEAGAVAAVASGVALLGLGLEGVGSLLRPASLGGVYGFRPSTGAVSRRGVLPLAPSLDTIAWCARSLEDLALLGDVLWGYDPLDETTALAPPPRLFDIASGPVPVKPTLAFVDLPFADQADADTHTALQELESVLAEQAFRLELPELFREGLASQACLLRAEMSRTLRHYAARGLDSLGPQVQQALRQGEEVRARQYLEAKDWIPVLRAGLDEVFARCDALVVPATAGNVPKRSDTAPEVTAFQDLWSLCGLPVVTLPLFQNGAGLPMGVQLVGRRGGDARLLRTARWLVATVHGDSTLAEEKQ